MDDWYTGRSELSRAGLGQEFLIGPEAPVGPSWPSRERYRQLTEQEEAADLLVRSDIRSHNGRNAALERIGTDLEGHTLRFRASASQALRRNWEALEPPRTDPLWPSLCTD